MEVSTFLKVLLSASPEEINDIIKDKGKEPKLIRGVIYETETK